MPKTTAMFWRERKNLRRSVAYQLEAAARLLGVELLAGMLALVKTTTAPLVIRANQ